MGQAKSWFRIVGLGMIVGSAPACLVEAPDGQARHQEKGYSQEAERTRDPSPRGTTQAGPGLCQYGIGRGCFDGYIGFKKDFFVGGQSFFNADDFAASFGELLQVKGPDGILLKPDQDFQVTFLTPIDQMAFVGGFEYELSGELQRSGKIPESGAFSASDLLDGTYELRIQRPIRFLLVKNQTTTPVSRPESKDSETEAPLPQTETVTKGYCATLFQDAEVQIRKGFRTYERLNDFKLHLSDRECDLKKHQVTLSL